LCSISAVAAEAYACYTLADSTLTFYYDTQRSSRAGTTYDLNTSTDAPGWYTAGINSSVLQVVFAPSFANARPTSTYGWFYEMGILESITGMAYLNTSEVTNMSYMFALCGELKNLDLSNFNTTKVTNMSYMFYECKALTSLDVSGFNTAKVTTMKSMFSDCYVLTSLDVSGFNTAKVTDMTSMFNECIALTGLNVSNFDTRLVTNMSWMFSFCRHITDFNLGNFNTDNVTKM